MSKGLNGGLRRLDKSAFEMKNNCSLFDSLFKKDIIMIFSFLKYLFFVLEILTFFYYANN